MAQCSCCNLPDVAKFAERLDAVGGDKGKLTFTGTLARIPVPDGKGYDWSEPGPLAMDALEATSVVARTFDLGSRPRGVPPIDALFAHHIISGNSFSVVTLLREVPPALQPDEIEAIVSDLTRRFDEMLRNALLGGVPK
jgi:hypothetical protein